MIQVQHISLVHLMLLGCCTLAFIPTSKGDVEPVLQKCCSIGSSWGSNHTTCTGPPLPVPGISAEDRISCHAAIYICCIRIHRHIQCEKGKQSARAGQVCSLLQTPGGEAHEDCCKACGLGLRIASQKQPCTFSNFQFGSPWDQAFTECCQNAASSHGLPPYKNNSLCARGDPCSQLCNDVGGRVECSCYQGFRLASDQRTCDDIDECELGRHNCNLELQICQNTVGGFTCHVKDSGPNQQIQQGQCPPGFIRNPQRQTCDDIDECAQNVCPAHELCVNNIGSYFCLPRGDEQVCLAGFRKHPQTGRCIDVDECAEKIDSCDRNEELCSNSHGSYHCQPKTTFGKDCPAGFKWDDYKAKCEDVDECSDDKHSCNLETQNCLNTIGSYHCMAKVPSCPHGYRREGDSCEDVDECLEKLDDCDEAKDYCVNTIGSFQCHKKAPPIPRCGIGFRHDVTTGICSDIDECEETKPCASDQTCENTQGSYTCLCEQGYTLDTVSKDCKDVNECQYNLHSCTLNQRCDNTIGSYVCVRTTNCGTGYTLNAHTSDCEDDDECALGLHNCGIGFDCRNTQGSFRCDRVKCPTGQKLMQDGNCHVVTCPDGMGPDPNGNCIDINECINSNICQKNQRCINSIGSYRCQNLIHCSTGFDMNEYGTQCVDIDECTRGLHECGPQQICRNRAGGYTCECPTGYALNAERQCEDIDECTRFQGQICSITSACENTQGSYTCDCKEGYKKAEDGKNCVDIDECKESPNTCHQLCINVWGSFQCSCQQGYILAPDGRSCQDIDECTVWEGRGNLCIGLCINEPGSYSCSCPDGYRLNTDKRTCRDIDECQEQNVCRGENEVCLNTRGSFKCNIISCPPNYIRDRDHRNRCKRTNLDCVYGDTTCLSDPLSLSYNYLTFVSNMRIPLSGQLDLFTMRGPRFSTTSVEFSLELKDARAPEGTLVATRDYFHVRRTAFNEAMVSLIKTISGPQEIELELLMKIYHNGLFGGKAVAKIFIFVTRHEF